MYTKHGEGWAIHLVMDDQPTAEATMLRAWLSCAAKLVPNVPRRRLRLSPAKHLHRRSHTGQFTAREEKITKTHEKKSKRCKIPADLSRGSRGRRHCGHATGSQALLSSAPPPPAPPPHARGSKLCCRQKGKQQHYCLNCSRHSSRTKLKECKI